LITAQLEEAKANMSKLDVLRLGRIVVRNCGGYQAMASETVRLL
jgi:hypothetical protein